MFGLFPEKLVHIGYIPSEQVNIIFWSLPKEWFPKTLISV